LIPGLSRTTAFVDTGPIPPSSSAPTRAARKPISRTRARVAAAAGSASASSASNTAAPSTGSSTSSARPRSRKRGTDPLELLIPTLPVYSYRGYPSAPTVVYTRDADEADELAGALSGALGFDMEWCVSWAGRGGGYGGGAVGKRTAVVQMSDRAMVLVVQVSAMERE
jgi:hypothetical protein